ncbi:Tyrosinase domain containing protein [Trichuris trichiura]|uniref:Tyrosinase domain containing protein n=1 Tax=Trichuris trichiura TaxID=36087 RepID=A0A077ZGT3_TRITR|nr:Tyrosinase domain containing protein [Trichuris trichiura]
MKVHTCLQETIRATSQSQKRFSQNQLIKYCQRKLEWRRELISRSTVDSVKLTDNQKKWFVTLSTMRTMQQFEDYWRKNAAAVDKDSRKKILPAQRREIRTCTMDEWHRLVQALDRMKHDQIDGMSKYDILTIIHSSTYSPGSLFGPAFLPYHREFLKDFELALRMYDADVALPYWDSTMDESLPAPSDGIIWTKAFFGNNDGYLNAGPFKSWKTLHSVYNEAKVVREAGLSSYGSLLRSEDVQTIMSKTKYEELTTCVDPFFELVYGGVTLWVGGHMKMALAAPEDPVFYFHHAFTDLLWEQFRQKRQTKQQRETDYPEDSKSCNRNHYASTTMQPFQIKNQDGLADLYTQEFYTYDIRPTCSDIQPSCRSPYLFCHTAKSRCMSKVKLGGKCAGFENTDICYEGHCLEGKCQGNAEPIPELNVDPPDNVENGNQEKNGQNAVPSETDCSCNCDCTASDGKKMKYIKTLPVGVIVGKVSKDSATAQEKVVNEPVKTIDTEWVWIIVNVINRNVSPQNKGGSVTIKATGTDYVGTYSTTLSEQAKHPALLPGSVPVQVKNPRFGRGKTQVQIKATHSQTGNCESYCRRSKDFIGFEPCEAEITLTETKTRGELMLFPYASKVSDLVNMEKQFPSGSLIFICGTDSAVTGKVNFDEATGSSKCYYLRFEHFLLAGYADAVKQSLSSSECKNFCRTWRSPAGKSCSSLMHWEDDGTCVLLTENRKTIPHAFVFSPNEPVTYFEKICSLSKEMFEV